MLPEVCTAKLTAKWRQSQIDALVEKRKPSLLSSIAGAFGWEYLWLGLLKLVSDSLNFAPALFLNRLLAYLDTTSASTTAITQHHRHHHHDSSFAYILDILLNPGMIYALLLALCLFIKVRRVDKSQSFLSTTKVLKPSYSFFTHERVLPKFVLYTGNIECALQLSPRTHSCSATYGPSEYGLFKNPRYQCSCLGNRW